MTEQHCLLHNEQTFAFTLCRSAQRRTLVIQVHPDKLVVRAPTRVAIAAIYDFVRQKAEWIALQQQRWSGLFKSEPLTYQTGEHHYFLGQPYPLKIYVGGTHSVKCVRESIQITAPTRLTSTQIQSKLERFYQAQSQQQFPIYIEKWSNHAYFKKFNIAAVTIRRMKSRWGSLTKTGKMTLNRYLIKAAENCIDYVVLHEFCHFIHFNHSPAFYALMTELMPDWKERRQQLKQFSF